MFGTSRMVGISLTTSSTIALLVLTACTEVAPPRTHAGRDAASRLIDRAVSAFGGAGRLDQVRSVRFQARLDLYDPEGDVQQAESSTLLVGTDCMRQERYLDDGTHIVRVLDGAEVYLASNGQPIDVPVGLRDELRAELLHRRSVILRLRDRAILRHLGATRVDGHTVGLVEATIDGVTTTLAIDPDDGAIRSIRYRTMRYDGSDGEIHVTFRDFRDHDGILLPRACEATFDGEPLFASASLMTAAINNDDASACQIESTPQTRRGR